MGPLLVETWSNFLKHAAFATLYHSSVSPYPLIVYRELPPKNPEDPLRTLLTLGAAAIAALSSALAQDLEIPYEKFTLDNGLTVVVHEDRKAPIVGVSVWYKVGARDEPDGQTGFAHLFEHLMFEGSENVENWDKPLIEAGAVGINGTTNPDRTNYLQTVPTPALDRVLFMESDRMGHFYSTINQTSLDEQRGVVKNEKRQGENAPYGRAFGSVFRGLFPPYHPYGHETIGSMEDLEAATLEDVQAWFKKYYGPNNAVLVLAGDINAAEARPLVERYFGNIPAGPPLTTWDSWVPTRDTINRATMFDQVPQARIYRVWVAPGDTDPVTTDLTIATSILGDGKNSRLYKDLVYDKQIATDVSTFVYQLEMASMVGVILSVTEGQDVAEVEAELDRQLSAFLARPPKRDEVELVATKSRAATIRGLEQVGGFGGKGVTLAQGELIAGDPAFIFNELDELAAATPRSVQAAAQEWMRDNYYQLTVLPFEEGSTVTSDLDRSAGIPPVMGETELDFPEIQTAELSNGIKVVLAERGTVPVVQVAMQFDAGYAADSTSGQLGLATFTTRMLDEGAGKYSALELAAELEQLGTTLGAGSSLDTTAVQMSALKENLPQSLSLMADVIRRPTFPEEEIERQRALALNGIAQEKATPTSIALRMLPGLMFGEGHAYAIPLTGSGTTESVTAFTRDDLVGFQQTWMRPDNATIYVAGDTTIEEIAPLLERAFGNWSASGPAVEKNIAEVEFATPRVVLVNRPGSPQSFILAGHVSPPTSTDKFIELSALNDVLGGGFTSRLNTNLREEKGWSYGVQSFFVDAEGQRPFMVYAPVQTDRTGESISEILSEIRGLRGDKPPTEEELNRVILDNVRSLPGQFETAGSVLGSLLRSGRFGRPYNYPETLPARYRSLTSESVAAAASTVRPDQMIWLIVGDAAEIRDDLEALDIGEIEQIELSDL